MASVESVAKSISYWSTGDGDDTMVTLWNPADEPQSFTFVLYFTGGDGQYSVPIHLNERETRTFNISEIIHNGMSDADGNVILPLVHEGRAEIMGSNGENEHILLAMDAGVYNVRKATCAVQYCKTCQGAVDSWLSEDPFALPLGGSTQLSFSVQYKSGTVYDHTSIAAWTSSNTSIATVNAGLVSGVGAGSMILNALDNNVPDYSYNCYSSNPDMVCPADTGQSSSAPGTVPSVTISGPSTVLTGNAIQLTATGTPTGGTYSWSSSNANVTLTNGGTATVTATGASAGSSTLTVTYTYTSGETNAAPTATQAVTVTQPTVAITIAFAGSKSAGDNLSFGAASPPDCSESLGLQSCPSLWPWNIEGKGVVTDDASKWTVTQTKTVAFKGYCKNSSGTLVSFSSDGPIGPAPDPLNSSVVQQPAGQTTIYFIDGPGGANTDTVGGIAYPVDSLTLVQNFTTTFCSTTAPNVCTPINWYSKIVVDPGAKLDTTQSKSDLGTASTNF
jgi:hypothetical protein